MIAGSRLSAVSDEGEAGATSAGLARALAAAAQALLLYGLLDEAGSRALPPSLFVPLLVTGAVVPPFAMLGFGRLSDRALAAWLAGAAVVVAGLGFHDVTRAAFLPTRAGSTEWPSIQLWLVLVPFMFVANVLATDIIIERCVTPGYARHFDTAWKQAVQLGSALAFVGVFWGILFLGAGLFQLIGISAFRILIEKRWFAIPATTLAFAAAIHVTDVSPGLIRGIRSLALTLLSWLLPLIAAITAAFLISLPFTGLGALWRTHFGTSLLLTTAGLLIFFVNAAYRFDPADRDRSRVKMWSMRVGSIELLPVVALAGWAIGLRVAQHGWTVERILAASIALLAGTYALGYALAVVARPLSLKPLERTNLVSAYLFLVLVLALFSSVADPSRLMVADQVARLKAGLVAPGSFDYAALKVQGARWGREALSALSNTPDGPDAATIRAGASDALSSRFPFQAARATEPPVTSALLAERIKIGPDGRALPNALQQPEFWSGNVLPLCVRSEGKPCTARYVPLRNGAPESLVIWDVSGGALVFDQDENGIWSRTGRIDGLAPCWRNQARFDADPVSAQPHPWQDLVVGGHSYAVVPASGGCPG